MTTDCRSCGQPGRLYLSGVWCDQCSPHDPQPTPPPEQTLAAILDAAGRTMFTPLGETIVDARAIASGKRRASPTAYKAARAAVDGSDALGPPDALDDRAAGLVARALGNAAKAPRFVADPYVRDGDRVTSFAAAVKALPRSGTQRRLILDALVDAAERGYAGATDPELARRLALGGNSVRPRRGELVEMGLAEDSGRVRRHEGNDHIVWAPTSAAIAALHRGATITTP